MTAIPTGIAEAHEVDVPLTCDEGLFLIPEQLVERIAGALREAKAALLEADYVWASAQIVATAALVDRIEVDGGRCSFEGAVEGFYVSNLAAEATCPRCGTIHEVDL